MEGRFPARPRRGIPFGWPNMAMCLLLLASTSGCSRYIGTTAASFMRRAREDPDPNIRYLAYSKLASPRCYDDDGQRAAAVKLLIDKLEHAKEPVASRAVI